jgi:D-aspartate ligase
LEPEFYPLLFGGDINVYSVGRAFHEHYGIRCTAVGKYPAFPCWGSAILDYRPQRDIEDPAVFCQVVRDFAAAHAGKTVLCIGCGDSYVKLCAEHQGEFPENVIAPYISGELMNTLINKEKFYALCDQYGLDHPATVVHRREMGHDFDLPFGPPYICKPSNGVEYWAHPFQGNDKVFILQTRQELEATLDRVYASGYSDSMILQEFIPGDDSFMRVLTNYSDRNGQVKLMCLGHVLLEEHTPHGLGNHAVILLEENEALCRKIQAFLEDLHYVGFSNFDIKYDRRDGKYKLFEINCRQGRSNYYVTGGGYNVAKYFVEDRIERKDLPFTIAKNKALWSVVPLGVAYRYTPKEYHPEIRRLARAGAVTNSLKYAPDRAPKRLARIWKNQLGHYYKFKKYYHRPE